MRPFSKGPLRRVLTAAALLAGSAAVILAADITGRVTDGAGEPLMQATVRLLKPDSAFVSGTAADDNGHFELKGVKKGKYILETTYIGFAPKTLNIAVGDADMTLRPIALD